MYLKKVVFDGQFLPSNVLSLNSKVSFMDSISLL